MTEGGGRWPTLGGAYDPGKWACFGSDWYVRAHGFTPQAVTLVEDPDGDYRGWIGTGETDPEVVLYGKIFDIQFPYGAQAEVDAGRGRVVRLRVEREG